MPSSSRRNSSFSLENILLFLVIDLVSTATDMWSLGTLVYVLLSGTNPFLAETNQQIIENIMNAEFTFDEEAFREISLEAMDFVDRLLVKERKSRMTASEALQHPWLKQKTEKVSTKVIRTLKHRRYYHTLIDLCVQNSFPRILATLIIILYVL